MSVADPISQPVSDLWRLSVEQYHDMARQGIFADDDPVELLEGLLVRKMTVSPAHHRATHRVQDALRSRVPQSHYVASPSSVTLAASEPEPDVLVVRGSNDDYAHHHPGPGDVALVVEVSDASLRRDQGFKKAIYAKSSLPIYWIVNLIDRRVEVYTDPTGAADYRSHRDYGETESAPLIIDGREVARIPVREMLA
jgi:Uma2 family endonuclease